jgi:small GTP-binding protein
MGNAVTRKLREALNRMTGPPPLKVVFLGDTGTGKTSLISQYIDHSFTDQTMPTVGGMGRRVCCNYRDKLVDLVIWDTAGQERYRALIPLYYRGAAAAILVFDVCEHRSFMRLQTWVTELRSNVVDLILVVCGNKVDLERTVPETEAEEMAMNAGAAYCETSAKTGFGVDHLFQTVVRLIAEMKPALITEGPTNAGIILKTGGEDSHTTHRCAC